MPRFSNPDLITGWNNGTMAIQPTKTGHLGHFYVENPDETVKAWVFGEVNHYELDDGTKLFDHVRRGVLMGNLEQGKAFLAMCKELGLRVNDGMYVPFSNGQGVYADINGSRGTEARKVLNDYEIWDLKLALIKDLPSGPEIKESIERCKGFVLNVTSTILDLGKDQELWVMNPEPGVTYKWRIVQGEGELLTVEGKSSVFRATKPGVIIVRCEKPGRDEVMRPEKNVACTINVVNWVPMD